MKIIKIADMNDRELQEWTYRSIKQQERYLSYFATVLTICLIISGAGLALWIASEVIK